MTPRFSFEIFPAKTEEGHRNLQQTVQKLAAVNPEYISVTYGAGGSTQERSLQTVKYVLKETDIPVAAHLTCVGATTENVLATATEFQKAGINHFVALRGDMPGMSHYQKTEGGFGYADELVAALREQNSALTLSVAGYPEGHPEATSLEADIEHLKRKQDAGADNVVTQYCFETEKMKHFIDQARQAGVTIPIIPGIALITNFTQIQRFSAACGATIPQWLVDMFDHAGDTPQHHQAIATKLAAVQIQALLNEGIEEFHLYTLNHAEIPLALSEFFKGS